MSMRFYAHQDGTYYGATSDLQLDDPDLIEVSHEPPNEVHRWDITSQCWLVSEVDVLQMRRKVVADRAEALIDQGTQINEVSFRCDVNSISRLEGLVRGFERGAIDLEGKTYKTSAGLDLTFTTKEQVEAVLAAADDHRDWILQRSAQIQNMDPIPDPSDQDLWQKPAP